MVPDGVEDVGATAVRSTQSELAELNRAVATIPIRGARMPPAVQAWSGVEAPPEANGLSSFSFPGIGRARC